MTKKVNKHTSALKCIKPLQVDILSKYFQVNIDDSTRSQNIAHNWMTEKVAYLTSESLSYSYKQQFGGIKTDW